jgi:hypothetical protein
MDIVVTCPMAAWEEWIDEGDLPGEEAQYESHWMFSGAPPHIQIGERVYIVAYGRLRGYAPLIDTEWQCQLDSRRHCLIRSGGAVAVTIDRPIRGFRGWRYVDWDRSEEKPFPDWATAGVPVPPRQGALL